MNETTAAIVATMNPAPAISGRQAAAGTVGLAVVPGFDDALVADGEQAGQPQVSTAHP